jgi:hypothetical protein
MPGYQPLRFCEMVVLLHRLQRLLPRQNLKMRSPDYPVGSRQREATAPDRTERGVLNVKTTIRHKDFRAVLASASDSHENGPNLRAMRYQFSSAREDAGQGGAPAGAVGANAVAAALSRSAGLRRRNRSIHR